MIKLYFNWIESSIKRKNIIELTGFWINLWSNKKRFDKKYFENENKLIIDIVKEENKEYLIISVWKRYNWKPILMYSDINNIFIDNDLKKIKDEMEKISNNSKNLYWIDFKEIQKNSTIIINIKEINNRKEYINNKKIKYI